MRPLAIALITIIALVATTGCWLESDDPGGSDEERTELRDYAAAMRVWWLEVGGGELPSLVPSLYIDHPRVLKDPRAGQFGEEPLPAVEPPGSMHVLHDLLVDTVIALAVADADAELQGFYAGVAAAFCDPRDVGGAYGSELLWWDVAPLQIWRWGGDPCRAPERWAGGSPKTGDPWRDFQWGCLTGDLFGGLDEFGVSDQDLEDACVNAWRWGSAFDSAAHVWSAELIRLCGGQAVLLADPADALATCE